MDKKVSYLLTTIEVVGIVLLLWLFPTDTTTQIIVKTVLGLAWIFAFYFFRRKYNRK